MAKLLLPSPYTLRDVLAFPLRGRAAQGQVLLVTLVLLGLQLAFPPLALVIEAGYAMQVARRALFARALALPDALDWQQMARDGLRWWGVLVVFALPGLALWLAAIPAGFLVYSLDPAGGERLAFGILLFGWVGSGALAFVGAELAQIAATHALWNESFAAAFDVRAWGAVFLRRAAAFEAAALVRLALWIGLLAAALALALPAGMLCISFPLLLALAGVYLRAVSAGWTALLYRDGAGGA